MRRIRASISIRAATVLLQTSNKISPLDEIFENKSKDCFVPSPETINDKRDFDMINSCLRSKMTLGSKTNKKPLRIYNAYERICFLKTRSNPKIKPVIYNTPKTISESRIKPSDKPRARLEIILVFLGGFFRRFAASRKLKAINGKAINGFQICEVMIPGESAKRSEIMYPAVCPAIFLPR